MFSFVTQLVWLALSLVCVGLAQSALLHKVVFMVATYRYQGSLEFALTVITSAGSGVRCPPANFFPLASFRYAA